jgi:2-phospho-L-lactate/phosphoenolpyruvate guanylyltransferase
MPQGPHARPERVVVLVPVKGFGLAKRRLSPLLDAPHRAGLARRMAANVLVAARGLDTAVVCDDPEVASWASDHGAMVLHEPGRGLNGAIESGIAQLLERGIDRVIVCHADLPMARDLRWVADFDGITIVPDRRADGTNVLCLPTATPFTFSYGARSFQRHHDAALSTGLPVRVAPDRALSLDVDVPSDLRLVSPTHAATVRS